MKKAIITGASSGMGYEIAAKLINSGIKVINLSRTPSNLPITNIKTDLTKNKDIMNTIKLIKKKHQDADALILCSGVLHWHNVGEIPITEIDADFATNIIGSIKLTNGVMQIIKKNRGDILIVGSTSSFVCRSPGSSVYNATKHAVLGFVRSLQAEFKEEDVRVIGIYPGGFKSKLHIKAGTNLKQEDLMDPKYLAELIIFMLKLPRDMQVSEIIIDRKKQN